MVNLFFLSFLYHFTIEKYVLNIYNEIVEHSSKFDMFLPLSMNIEKKERDFIFYFMGGFLLWQSLQL